jgi:hypothetical protein|tara:strand:- start:385 stop:570 length:186 start_codon:yes stop_codon:yes gene_type:complete
MGLRDSFNKQKQENTQDSSLSKQELEFLLALIKQVTFKGEDVELLYNVVNKIQQQYINQNK